MKRIMQKIMHFLVLSCVDFTQLIEKLNWCSLPWFKKIQLHIHKKMCPVCGLFEAKQNEIEALINHKMQKQFEKEMNSENLTEFNQKTLEKLNNRK